MKFYFYTLGCKVNQYESQAMQELVVKKGHSVAKADRTADVVVVNSCTVTEEATKKCRKELRYLRRESPNAIIVLTGCFPTAFHDDAAAVETADIVIDNTRLDKIVEIVEEYLKDKKRLVSLKSHQKGEEFLDLGVSSFSERTRGYIKIEDGCDRFCSYCIIPTARGRVRSRSVESITAEAERLAQNGYKEVVLVGINLSAYGKGSDLELCDAVQAVAKVDGIKRIRLGSLEPDQISDRTFEYLANEEKFCPQFHFSLQSGCDKTLKHMNRHYTTDDYFRLSAEIKTRFENPSITTDIMVGFVGETDEDFTESVNFVSRIGFARSHVFSYSVRKGTRAEKMEGHVAESVKSKRSKEMIRVTSILEEEFLKRQVGTIQEVLFEERTLLPREWVGYTKNYSKVLADASGNIKNEIKKVKIVNVYHDCLCGVIID